MKDFLPLIEKAELFKGINSSLTPLLSCLSPVVLDYGQGQIIWHEGDTVNQIGLILSGTATISRVDAEGTTTIVAQLTQGDIFGEAFVGAGLNQSLVTVAVKTAAQVLFVDYQRILTQCPSNCLFHTKLIENFIQIITKKNLQLMDKLEILSCRSIRERLLAYLYQQRSLQGTNQIELPFNRNQLAAYLSVDRSALSRELSNMRKEQLLECKGNTFILPRL